MVFNSACEGLKVKALFKLHLEDGFMKAETCSCYVLLIIFYVIKLCWIIKSYISMITENTREMPYLKKLCRELQERSSTLCFTEITLLYQDPWIFSDHGLSPTATFSWYVVVRSWSYELLNSSPLTDLQKNLLILSTCNRNVIFV
jgi:hypothetical protein